MTGALTDCSATKHAYSTQKLADLGSAKQKKQRATGSLKTATCTATKVILGFPVRCANWSATKPTKGVENTPIASMSVPCAKSASSREKPRSFVSHG